MIKTFTFQEFVDAIRKDGYKKAKCTYFRDKRGVKYSAIGNLEDISAACAYGQAAINLGLPYPSDIRVAHTRTVRYSDPIWRFSDEVIRLNDRTSFSMARIADELEKKFPELMSQTFEIEVDGEEYQKYL